MLNMEDRKYRMYSIVMYNISSMQKGVQTAHAVIDYSMKHGGNYDFRNYAKNDKTLIILDGGTYQDMVDLKNNLDSLNVKYGYFEEPDLNNCITSICFLVDERVWNFKEYPDYEKWYKSNNNCENVIFDDYNYEKYSVFVGGEKNFFLKEFIRRKKLSM